MRILHVTNMWPSSSRPTSGTFVKEMVNALRNLGGIHDVFHIDSSGGSSEYLRAVPRLRDCLKRSNYDLIHSQYAHSALVSRRASSLPLVAQFHGEFGYQEFGTLNCSLRTIADLFKTKRDLLMAKLAARLASGVIVVSRDHLTRVTCARKTCIPLGVDAEVFRPIDRKAACDLLGLKQDRRRVIFGSDPSRPDKNYSLFSNVLEIVRNAGIEIDELHLVNMTRKEVAAAMNCSDLLLLTSHTEASPTVVKEACLCNLPVVSADVGDVRWQLEDLRNCRVVPHDISDMFTAAREILKDGRRSDGWISRHQQFSITATAERLNSFYERVLGSA